MKTTATRVPHMLEVTLSEAGASVRVTAITEGLILSNEEIGISLAEVDGRLFGLFEYGTEGEFETLEPLDLPEMPIGPNQADDGFWETMRIASKAVMLAITLKRVRVQRSGNAIMIYLDYKDQQTQSYLVANPKDLEPYLDEPFEPS